MADRSIQEPARVTPAALRRKAGKVAYPPSNRLINHGVSPERSHLRGLTESVAHDLQPQNGGVLVLKSWQRANLEC